MKPARLAPEAVAELNDAAAWYESRRPGLARQFLQTFESVILTGTYGQALITLTLALSLVRERRQNRARIFMRAGWAAGPCHTPC